MSATGIGASDGSSPFTFSSGTEARLPSQDERVGRHYMTRNVRHTIYLAQETDSFSTKFTIVVLEPELKNIGSKQVEFYKVSTRTDYDGFKPITNVERRFSEFQTLQKVLFQRGVTTLPLSMFQWIPRNISRWEELLNLGRDLGDSILELDEDCLKELKRFCEDPSPYHADEQLAGLSFWERRVRNLL